MDWSINHFLADIIKPLRHLRGEIGIQKLRLEDPFEFKVRRIDKRRVFADLAFQAPEISFIEVTREISRSEDFYRMESPPDPRNLIKIIGNGNISKEIDDMITVALFLRLTDLGKESYIQSCDKYRWMYETKLSRREKRQVKEKVWKNLIIKDHIYFGLKLVKCIENNHEIQPSLTFSQLMYSILHWIHFI